MPLPVGCHDAAFFDGVQQAKIPFWLLYPSTEGTPVSTSQFGPYAIDVAEEGPVEGEGLRLVLMSHGRGGTPFAYRDLALGLAREGFAVGLIEHTGHSRSDSSLDGKVANLENRPRHLRLAIDAAFADPLLGPRLSTAPVAVIGHSMGGYTALACTGGKPRAFPYETPDGQPRDVAVERDPRIGAIVLMAPAAAWYAHEGALREVDVPVLMFTGQKDELASAFHRGVVESGLPDPAKLDHRLIPNAGHFSFMSPFPPAMVSPTFPPSQDPPGFDRAAFVPVLGAEILAFLRLH